MAALYALKKIQTWTQYVKKKQKNEDKPEFLYFTPTVPKAPGQPFLIGFSPVSSSLTSSSSVRRYTISLNDISP